MDKIKQLNVFSHIYKIITNIMYNVKRKEYLAINCVCISDQMKITIKKICFVRLEEKKL